MQKKPVPALFVRRVNRFSVLAEREGKMEEAHLPNSGRMTELLVPGAPVILRKAANLSRKTAWDLSLVRHEGKWVSVDSRLPNGLMREAFLKKRLPPFRPYCRVRQEVAYGKSRLDFRLESDEAPPCLVEVKSVNLVRDGVALFPDAPTQRGSRHLMELVRAKKEGLRSAAIFVIQREDAQRFSPNREMDAAFSGNLKKAYRAGVELYAYTCVITPAGSRLKEPIEIML